MTRYLHFNSSLSSCGTTFFSLWVGVWQHVRWPEQATSKRENNEVIFFCVYFKLSQIIELSVHIPLSPCHLSITISVSSICNYRRWCCDLAKFAAEVTSRRVSWNNRFLWPENQWSSNHLPNIEWLAQVNLITKEQLQCQQDHISYLHMYKCQSCNNWSGSLVVQQLHVLVASPRIPNPMPTCSSP